jgi:hypothetical protein
MAGADRASGPEVADIFREFGAAYRQAHALPTYQRKAMQAIEQCRTAALGGHIDECERCGHTRVWYNSCRNRHCPKCQFLAKEQWLAARQKELLPIVYFHCVFTIPCALNPLALVNQKVVYGILLKAAAETLLELGRDPKHVGGDLGVIAVLHTWGQNLMDHPHVHCIVTGGGLSPDGKRWLRPKKMTKERDFFVHVNVISALFRGKFLAYLKPAYRNGKLKFVGKTAYLSEPKAFQQLLDELYGITWNTYCKEPFAGPEQVLRYLGQYTHRVAISNHRIVKVDDGKVTFRWRDYKDGSREKLMTLDAFEFIRRFLLHILPHQFFKIRHYGLLANRHRKAKIKRCREILGVTAEEMEKIPESQSWQELMLELTGVDVRTCPVCGEGRMVSKEILRPQTHSPPQ